MGRSIICAPDFFFFFWDKNNEGGGRDGEPEEKSKTCIEVRKLIITAIKDQSIPTIPTVSKEPSGLANRNQADGSSHSGSNRTDAAAGTVRGQS